MSSRIQATYSEQILSKFKRSTSSARLHSSSTFKKLMLRPNCKGAVLTKEVVVQMELKVFSTRTHDAANTSPLLFCIRRPKPSEFTLFLWNIYFFLIGFERLRIFMEEMGEIEYQPQLEETKNGYQMDQWLVFSDVDGIMIFNMPLGAQHLQTGRLIWIQNHITPNNTLPTA